MTLLRDLEVPKNRSVKNQWWQSWWFIEYNVLGLMSRSWSTCEVGAAARNPCTYVLVRSTVVPAVAMKFILSVIFTPDFSIIIRTVTLGTPTRHIFRTQSTSPPFLWHSQQRTWWSRRTQLHCLVLGFEGFVISMLHLCAHTCQYLSSNHPLIYTSIAKQMQDDSQSLVLNLQ